MHRREVLASAALLGTGIAGCSETDPGAGTGSPTPDGIGTDQATGTQPATESEHAAEQPDPDLAVVLVNRHDDPHTLALTVTRDGDEVVHESVHDLGPGEELVAYNLQSADPDGVEEFTITVELGEDREEVPVQTSECYGDVQFSVDTGGELDATYAVC